jgi:hypothetical protein
MTTSAFLSRKPLSSGERGLVASCPPMSVGIQELQLVRRVTESGKRESSGIRCEESLRSLADLFFGAAGAARRVKSVQSAGRVPDRGGRGLGHQEPMLSSGSRLRLGGSVEIRSPQSWPRCW